MPLKALHPWALLLVVLLLAAGTAEEIREGHKGLLTLSGPQGGGLRSLELGVKGEQKIKLREHEKVLVRITGNHSQAIEYFSTALFATCPADLDGNCLQNQTALKRIHGSIPFDSSAPALLVISLLKARSTLLRLRLHHQQDPSSLGGCRTLDGRTVHREFVKEGQCFEVEVGGENDHELVMQRESDENVESVLSLCDYKLPALERDFQEDRYRISTEQVKKRCTAGRKPILKILFTKIIKESTAQNETNSTIKHKDPFMTAVITIIVEEIGQPILLAEGLGYSTTLTDTNCKYFHYELLSRANLTVNIHSQAGVEIYADIVNVDNRTTTQPTASQHRYTSKSGFLFTYFRPHLIITHTELAKLNCADCFLVAAVCLSTTPKQPEQITIEIGQHSVVLSEGVMHHRFLPAHSVSYYSYAPRQDGPFFVQLSDNNHRCARTFVSNIEPPASDNCIEKGEDEVTVTGSQKLSYYIAVEALKDCAYSIVVTGAGLGVTKLEKGRFGHLNLQSGQSKLFLIHGSPSKYIKLLSNHVYGRVEIYLNRTTPAALRSLHLLNMSHFQRKGQLPNRLLLSNNDSLFCGDCYYLVNVVASKNTESTLFFGDETTPILIKQKVLNDIIPTTGDKVVGEYYGSEDGSLEVRVHSGKLRVTLSKHGSNFSRDYDNGPHSHYDNFQLSQSQSFLSAVVSFFDWTPAALTIEALADNTVYSLQLKSVRMNLTEDDDRRVTLQAGKSSYLVVGGQGQAQTCLEGYLRDSSEKILLSCDYDLRARLPQLVITAKAGQRNMNLTKETTQNIMTLSLPALQHYYMGKGLQLQICINLVGPPLWLTVLQSQDFSLLPPQVDTTVRGNFTFVVHSQSDLIVDLFECSGPSSIIYSPSREELTNTSSKSLDLIGLPGQPHAVRVNRYSTTFFQLTAPLALARWFPFDIQKGIGTGYLDFQAGEVHFGVGFFGLDISWQSLTRVADRGSTVDSVKYSLYISSNVGALKSASQCELQLGADTLKIEQIVDPSKAKGLNLSLAYTVQKNQLGRFSSSATLYATVVADLTLLPPPSNHSIASPAERYRFIYQSTEMPQSLLFAQPLDSLTFNQQITILLLSIVVLLVFAYVCSRKIVPLLGRLKNRVLVEEEQVEEQPPIETGEGLETVPPSSDRQSTKNHDMMEKDDYIEAK